MWYETTWKLSLFNYLNRTICRTIIVLDNFSGDIHNVSAKQFQSGQSEFKNNNADKLRITTVRNRNDGYIKQ